MSREEIQKLLGGYATDTLSESERRALFEAALEDQELFDTLAKEQALRDVLREPAARRQLLEALGPAREPFGTRAWRWLRQPVGLAAAGSVAAMLIVAGVVLRRTSSPAPEKVLVAQVPQPPAEQAAPAKVFQPPPPRAQKTAPLPAPPVIRERAAITGRPPVPAPVAQPVPPAPTEQTQAVLAEPAAPLAVASALQREDEARRLYDRQSVENLTIRTADMVQAQAKPKRPNGAPSPLASNLGLRYSLLVRGSDGAYAPARLETVFHVGDEVRLRLEPNDTGYVYLFQRDSTGGLRLAFTQRVQRGQASELPAGGALRYDEPGRKQLLLVFSRRPQPELAGLGTPELDALASGARSHILQAAASSDESAYVVDARLQPAEQKVAFEITLEYR
jgi:hypothetical protein